MSNNGSQHIVQKLWNCCHILHDDGLSYGDYVEQLTYLLFLKMAHERTQPPYNQPPTIPAAYNWETLRAKDGDALVLRHRHILEASLADGANLPAPDILAAEIVDDLRAALEEFELIAADLAPSPPPPIDTKSPPLP